MSSRQGIVQNTMLLALGIGAVVGTADLATRVAFSPQRVTERAIARTTAGAVDVVMALSDDRTNIRVVLPSPYGR